MKRLLCLFASLLLAAALAGCAAGETAPKLTEQQAIDLIWNYEMHLMEYVKNADPTQFVTDLEAKWLEEYLGKKKAGEKVAPEWLTNGSVIKLTRATTRQAEVKLQWQEGDKLRTVTFKLTPVNGQWKIANHTTLDGKWWAPAQ